MQVATVETNGVETWKGVVSDSQALIARLKHERPELVAAARAAIELVESRGKQFVPELSKTVTSFAADHMPGPTPHHTVAEFLASVNSDMKKTPETVAAVMPEPEA